MHWIPAQESAKLSRALRVHQGCSRWETSAGRVCCPSKLPVRSHSGSPCCSPVVVSYSRAVESCPAVVPSRSFGVAEAQRQQGLKPSLSLPTYSAARWSQRRPSWPSSSRSKPKPRLSLRQPQAGRAKKPRPRPRLMPKGYVIPWGCYVFKEHQPVGG